MTAAHYRNPARPDSARDQILQRGLDLLDVGRLDEAEFSLTAALAKNPAGFEPLHFLAVLRRQQGREREALDLVKRALRQRPQSSPARALQSELQSLIARDHPAPGAPLAASPAPRWNGEYVAGTLQVCGQQGLGEQILHASMLPDAARRADRVVAEVEPRLVPLFARSFPAIRVIATGSESQEPWHAHAPMPALARWLRPHFNTFPNRTQGFLSPDRARVAALRGRLAGDGRLVVGLSWRSRKNAKTAKARSARLQDFASVLRMPNCRFVALQHGDTRAECAAVASDLGVHVEHIGDVDNGRDIDGLAALMTACDIVVSVSNAAAHLAGALGRPTWVFVPHGAARPWYWFEEGEHSPWYPHLRLRRQASGQAWADLIAANADDIW